MALVLLVRRGRDPDVDIRLRDRVDRILQRALAQQCRPCEFVSSVSLTKVDIVGERYWVNAVGLDDCEFGHDAGRIINIRNVYVSLSTVSFVVYASSMFWHRPRDNHSPINCRVESIGKRRVTINAWGAFFKRSSIRRPKAFVRLNGITYSDCTHYYNIQKYLVQIQGGSRYAHQIPPPIFGRLHSWIWGSLGLTGGFGYGSNPCYASSRLKIPNISQYSESNMKATFDCELGASICPSSTWCFPCRESTLND